MTARRGHLLVEALCALALAGLLAAACGTALLRAGALLEVTERRARAERGALEALQVAAALLRDADSLVLLGDTAAEFAVPIADAVVCARDAAGVTLPPVRTAAAVPLAQVAQPVEAGDEVRALVHDPVDGRLRWVRARIDSVHTRSGDAACGAASAFADPADGGAERLRLVVAALDARVQAGTPVRIGRRGRLAPYHVGRGEWMLGWRRCSAGTCGVVQPVAGPLRAPASEGFAVHPAGDDLAVRVGAFGTSHTLALPVTRVDAGH